MLKSMTGFGRATAESDKREISVEIKSINHRYLDLTVKTPRVYSFLEEPVKKLITASIARGKVEVFVSVKEKEDNSVTVTLNHPLVSGYLAAADEIREKFGLCSDVSVSTVLRLPDALIIDKDEPDAEEIIEQTQKAAAEAISAFDSARAAEGENLCRDILYRAGLISEFVDYIEKRSPDSVEEYREKIAQRMTEILGDTDIAEQRILAEAALFADKVSVTEEIIRLRSHIKQLEGLINGNVPAGRKLDFLIQEFNRESNTIGSKASDYPITKTVVDLKAEIEKIREQIQNLE